MEQVSPERPCFPRTWAAGKTNHKLHKSCNHLPRKVADPFLLPTDSAFFLEVVFDESIMATLIASLFAPEDKWQLSMDRTNWMFGIFKINILFLAINYKGMSIPILWTLLPKKGCSNTTERIELKRFQKIFPEQAIQRLLMDREFKGKQWLKYLVHSNWPICIRVPNNTLVPNKHQNRLLPVTRIFSL
ncbi:hypothetical protein J7438_21740 [Thalassotalea sp. G20_0]|uniref:hypothetical protein n=1 Tax=Thalassotalea sp. G20_0 TaxID=2821093 RepID=UPI001ADA6298|nr:hypothetical protein [Thalassotalea sp. G20_0]MBO9496685.1 hypothetical protein [Thalassotalea sp. G20_0]